jgi:hypothetical protein
MREKQAQNLEKCQNRQQTRSLLANRQCQFCGQSLGVMQRFFQDARKPWCLQCWIHGPSERKLF